MVRRHNSISNPQFVSQTAPENDALPLAANGTPCRILIVEDDALIALDLQQTVEEMGGTVVGHAAHAENAVGLAARHKPDVVLMDIRLAGGSDGIDAARGIRQKQDVAIIFVTGNSDPGTRSRVLEFSDALLLTKPVDHMQLGAALRERCLPGNQQR